MSSLQELAQELAPQIKGIGTFPTPSILEGFVLHVPRNGGSEQILAQQIAAIIRFGDEGSISILLAAAAAQATEDSPRRLVQDLTSTHTREIRNNYDYSSAHTVSGLDNARELAIHFGLSLDSENAIG